MRPALRSSWPKSALVVVTALAAASTAVADDAATDDEQTAAEATDATPSAPPEDDQVFVGGCVDDDDRRAWTAGREKKAFGARPVPLGPLFWATADRSLVQAMLLYWRVVDVDEGTKLNLLVPFYLNHCSPQARTTLGPIGLFGSREDAQGSAGWWGPYFYRRDRVAQSDVLFPLFWSLRDDDSYTLVAGPWFDVKRGAREYYGLLPGYFGTRHEDGSYFDAAPGFVAWSDGQTENLWAFQTFRREDAASFTTVSPPFYFSHGDKLEGTGWAVIPPLLSAAWGDKREDLEGLIAGPYYSIRKREQLRRGVMPFWLSYRGANEEFYDVAPLLGTAVWGDEHQLQVLALQTHFRSTTSGWRLYSVPFFGAGSDRDGSHFALIPPLLFGHVGDARETRTFAGQTYVHRYDIDKDGVAASFDAFSAPFYFGGRDKDGSFYDVVPPLFARWGNERDFDLLLGPNWYRQRGSQWTALVPPMYFGRADEKTGSYLVLVPPLMSAFWSDGETEQQIVAGYYDLVTSTGAHFGVAPFYLSGSSSLGASSVWAWAFRETLLRPWVGDRDAYATVPTADFHYRLAPPLLYAHIGTPDAERTLFANTFIKTTAKSWMVWSIPFYFGGAEGDESYHIVPPALFGSAHSPRGGFTFAPGFYQDRKPTRTLTLALQTRAEFGPGDHWSLWSVPFYFGGGDSDGHYHVVAPLLSGESYDKTDGSYFRLIAPALLAGWHDRSGTTSIIGPYVDARSTDGRRFSALLPLYAGTENEVGFFDLYSPFFVKWGTWQQGGTVGARQADTTRALLLPFLGYYASTMEDTLLLAPGVWHRSDASSSDTVVLPAYVDIQRPGFEATVIAGGYWDFAWQSDDGSPRSLTLLPAYARWEDPTEVIHVAGPVAWSSGKGNQSQSWSFHAEPFVSLWSYHPDHFRWQVGLGAFGYEREQDKEQVTLFWVPQQSTEDASPGG